MRKIHVVLVFLISVVMTAVAGYGQSALLDLPRDSQHALVSQRIGLTDVTINYHRPLVKGREVWGKLVPYGQVWRAGANENTTISFSTPVTIEGQPLDQGTYGLHMIPNHDQWTVIFSKVATAWGSFSYDQKEDALRVNVKPHPEDMHEALTYGFDDVNRDSAIAVLAWEKLAVPFKIGVKTDDIVAQSLHKQLRGIAQYTWQGWDDAANYFLANKTNLEEALKDEDQSIQVEERFDNLMTKSRILEAMGREEEAKPVLAKALTEANPLQLHMYARQLQGQKKQDAAFAIFRENFKKHPDQWFVHTGMARVYTAQGNFDGAVKEMKLALSTAPDQSKSYVESLVKRLEDKDDINK
jgi:tetratricopeptide (TPR) repeat protein